jgi:transcriptional regulator with AAA-type ATPase domain
VATELTTDTVADRSTDEGVASPDSFDCGLLVLSSAESADTVGAWLPAGGVGDGRVLGRGEARSTDPYPRMAPVRQLPGSNVPLPPLAGAKLSRTQLEIIAEHGGLVVRNIGAAALKVNGVELPSARVGPGDILEVGSSLMLYCTRRPSRLPAVAWPFPHAFGEADAVGIVGESPTSWALRGELAFFARHPGHVLVTGASGAGKELAVRALHRLGAPDAPLVERNAATIPEGLIDAELFGNIRNYPNPGTPERPGLLGAAEGGVLFLDEFAELPSQAQTHLLRVLDAGQYQRLGDSRTRTARFRLLAATNRPLSALREDVLARFAVRIAVPPLAARRDDIPLILRRVAIDCIAGDALLAQRFLDATGVPRFAHELLRRVMRHSLTTNVRELAHIVTLSLAKSRGEALEWVEPQSPGDVPQPSDDPIARVQHALDHNNGSIERTWRALGFPNRFALMRHIKKHRLVVHRKGG